MLELFVEKNEMVELSQSQINTIMKIIVLNANEIYFIGCQTYSDESWYLPPKYTYRLLLDGIGFKRNIRLTKNEWRSLCAIHQAAQLMLEENCASI